MVGSKGVTIKRDLVEKKFKSDLTYQRELSIYKKRLSYIPKLISSDDKKRILVLDRACCVPLSKIPLKDRHKYYPRIKKLFYKFHKDTGFYLHDFNTNNILINEKTNSIKLIDFETIGKNFKVIKSLRPFFKKLKISFK